MNIGYEVKRTLEWDPVKEKFKNDSEADLLLKPMFREGWSLKS